MVTVAPGALRARFERPPVALSRLERIPTEVSR